MLVLLILGLFGWAVGRGQFEDVEREGERILDDEGVFVENHQESCKSAPEQSFAPDREECLKSATPDKTDKTDKTDT
jgi:nitrogen fixation-related uncharacterized protein